MAALKPRAWRIANRRRLELIQKRFAGGLTDAEEEELRGLQELADRQLEELDTRMLAHLAKMEADARRVIDREEQTKSQRPRTKN